MFVHNDVKTDRLDKKLGVILATSPCSSFLERIMATPHWDGNDRMEALAHTLVPSDPSPRGRRVTQLLVNALMIQIVAAADHGERSCGTVTGANST